MSYLLTILLFIAAGYGLSRLGTRILFKSKKKLWPLTLPFKQIWLAPRLSGVYLPAAPGKATLLFFHGRGGNISHFESFAKTYAPRGYGILMADYPGFGFSAGTPSQKQLETTALAAVSYALEQLKIVPQQLVLYGHSLGNYPALFAARHFCRVPLKALVLQSPFLSAPQLAAAWAVGYRPHTWYYRLLCILVSVFLPSNRFDNTRLTPGLALPTLVCMSKTDDTLPWQISAKLADGLVHAQRFLSVHGGHDEFTWPARAVDKFLSA